MTPKTDIKEIQLLLLDMDGVLTDGGIYLSQDGSQMRRFHAHDGQGIKNFLDRGRQIGIITGSKETQLILNRTNMLGISEEWVSVATENKLEVYNEWLHRTGLQAEQVGYIGDDTPDIPLMKAVGVSACPADAIETVRQIADIVLHRDGGQGCVREMIDEILA